MVPTRILENPEDIDKLLTMLGQHYDYAALIQNNRTVISVRMPEAAREMLRLFMQTQSCCPAADTTALPSNP